jgi:hypothetical protein
MLHSNVELGEQAADTGERQLGRSVYKCCGARQFAVTVVVGIVKGGGEIYSSLLRKKARRARSSGPKCGDHTPSASKWG